MATAPAPAGYLLFKFAAAHVQGMGRRFGDGAEQRLRELTEQAGTALDAIDDEDEREAQLASAQESLAELLDRAAAMARDLDDYPDDLLGERSFFPALAWFCPRFPFC